MSSAQLLKEFQSFSLKLYLSFQPCHHLRTGLNTWELQDCSLLDKLQAALLPSKQEGSGTAQGCLDPHSHTQELLALSQPEDWMPQELGTKPGC